MTDYLERGDAAHVLDVQHLATALRGDGVGDGCAPSKGASALETDVASGTAFVDGATVTVAGGTVTHDAGDVDPRFDVVYIDNLGAPQIAKGTPAAAISDDGAAPFADDPFAYWSPAPDPPVTFTGAPVAVVAIESGATDYTAATHLRDVTEPLDLLTYALRADSELRLPLYDAVADAPAEAGSLIKVTGDGVDLQGVWVYDAGDAAYNRVGEDALLSAINVDTAAKDWEGADFDNVGSVEPTGGFKHTEGNGDVSFGRHTNYTDTAGAWEETGRLTLDADQALEISLLDVKHKGGGTDPNFQVRFVDQSGPTVLVSTSDRFRAESTTPTAVAQSAAGATITKEINNNTGAAVNVCISHTINIVESP